MKRTKTFRGATAVAICCCLLLATMLTAYAADIGGFRRTVRIWFNGEQTDVTMTAEAGSYTLTDADGTIIGGGGGVAMDAFGNERPLTAEELAEELELLAPHVDYYDDGTAWLYYGDQAIDITNDFVDGVCRLELEEGDHPLYVTVTENGLAASADGYIDP